MTERHTSLNDFHWALKAFEDVNEETYSHRTDKPGIDCYNNNKYLIKRAREELVYQKNKGGS